MIKVNFKYPVVLWEDESIQASSVFMFVICKKVKQNESGGFIFIGYQGCCNPLNIKSIEHVKPTDL